MKFFSRLIKKTSFFTRRLYFGTTITNKVTTLCVLSTLMFAPNSYASTKILVWGDSLSAAYGIPIEKGWVNLLQEKLGDDVEIINGSISGETSQGGLTRFPKALETHSPDIVVLELGANDGLRGISPNISKKNLQQIIEQANQAQAQTLLLGMKIPPNYGPIYAEQFEKQFTDLAETYELAFIPFFLEKVMLKAELLQPDDLHPTAEAQPIILEAVYPSIKEIIDTVSNTE